jgi:hypothetical protein
MPPSPWLSARSTKIRYLMTTTSTIDQKKSEITPSTESCVASWCMNDSRTAYRGEVPMSPYTTPSAPRDSAASARLLGGFDE